MNSKDMETICKHYMSKLNPADLAELDAQLDGGDEPESAAMDSRLPAHMTGKKWLAMDSRSRNAIRQTWSSQSSNRADAAKGFGEMFPNAANIKVR